MLPTWLFVEWSLVLLSEVSYCGTIAVSLPPRKLHALHSYISLFSPLTFPVDTLLSIWSYSFLGAISSWILYTFRVCLVAFMEWDGHLIECIVLTHLGWNHPVLFLLSYLPTYIKWSIKINRTILAGWSHTCLIDTSNQTYPYLAIYCVALITMSNDTIVLL